MAKPQLGTKRLCLSCGAKFYDLNRDPILCPKCGALFVAQQLARRPEAAKADDDEEAVIDPVAADLVPLEEAEGDAVEKVLPGEDIEVEDDIGGAADDTFLETEEEEEDGDVSDLIGGDIEEDEET